MPRAGFFSAKFNLFKTRLTQEQFQFQPRPFGSVQGSYSFRLQSELQNTGLAINRFAIS